MKKISKLTIILFIIFSLDNLKAESNNIEKYGILTLKTYAASFEESDFYPASEDVKVNHSLIGYDNTYNKLNDEVLLYTKEECVKNIKIKILNYFKDYYYDISFAYCGHGIILRGVRYICVPESIIEKNKKDGKIDEQILLDNYRKYNERILIPLYIPSDNIDSNKFNLFPFDPITNGDIKESTQLMQQMDKEIMEIGKMRYTASFDCKLSNLSPVETVICTYEDLGKLDINLNNKYREVIKKYQNNITKRKEIVNSQKKWIEERNKLETYYQIKDSYEGRIKELEK